MVHSNKVLTVSYGTFSCTLEGFDDSFGTMKAIAEYFRDLAADDRYFGAEPPQPDADLLARIAQREISRRVEAHTDGSAVVLTAQADTPESAPAQAETVAERAPESEEVAAPVVPVAAPLSMPEPATTALQDSAEPVAESPAPDIEVLDPDTETPARPAPAGDSIAEKLQRIRAVVDRDGALAPTGSDTLTGIEPENAELAQAFATQEDDAAEITPVSAEDHEAAAAEQSPENTGHVAEQPEPVQADTAPEAAPEEIVQDNVAGTFSEAPEDLTTAPFATQTAEPGVAADEQPVQPEDGAAAAETSVEPNIAEDAPHTPAVTFSEAPEDRTTAPFAAQPVAEDAPSDTLADLVADTVAHSAVDLADTAIAPQPVDEPASEDVADDAQEDVFADPSAPFDLSNFEAALADDGETAEDEDPFETPEPRGDDTIFGALDDLDDTFEDDGFDEDPELTNILADDSLTTDTTTVNRGRVIKVKRTDLEAAIAKGDLEQVDAAGPDDVTVAPTAPTQERPISTLSPEDEADLQRELSVIEKEAAAEAASQVEPDADVPRLLAEAGEKMAEEESATNRETYAHMRAAVAVTRAEEEAEDGPPLLSLDEKYRKDLETVVRPDRPMTRTSNRTRPASRVTAPLKLVAEQRVDTQDTGERAPVQPRRVTTAMLDDTLPTQEEGGAFAEFVRDVGAHTLPDLLEAAAAYMSFVEGREKFSRPQLMTKVRQVEKDDFNREDGLRSFGQLLRQGKIAKVGGGRFTASPDIGFQPEDRAAG